MAATTVKLVGGPRLASQLLKLAMQRDEICAEALEDWADDVQDGAEAGVPVDSGALRTALDQKVHRGAHEAEVGVWSGNAPGAGDADPAVYAQWTEAGNSRQRAQPFLVPAFEAHRNIRPYIRDALHRRL